MNHHWESQVLIATIAENTIRTSTEHPGTDKRKDGARDPARGIVVRHFQRAFAVPMAWMIDATPCKWSFNDQLEENYQNSVIRRIR